MRVLNDDVSLDQCHSRSCQMMYGVLYAMSAEIFPAKHRGTGNGLTGTANRVFGVMVRLVLV